MPSPLLSCMEYTNEARLATHRQDGLISELGQSIEIEVKQAHPKRLVTAEAIQSEEPAFRFCRGLLFSVSVKLVLGASSVFASDLTPVECKSLVSSLDAWLTLASTSRLVGLRPV